MIAFPANPTTGQTYPPLTEPDIDGRRWRWTGSAWTAGLGTDTLNTRRRFVPSGSLPGSVDLYATITVA